MHKKPINRRCPFPSIEDTASQLGQNDISSLLGSGGAEQLNLQILAELKNLGGRMTVMENEFASTKAVRTQVGTSATLSTTPTGDGVCLGTSQSVTTPDGPSALPTASVGQQNAVTTGSTSVQTIIPSLSVLQSNSRIQDQVDQRLRQLTELNEAGKLKSQRGGNETVFVKKQVMWPQNFVLGGQNKSRISYDNLSMCQWVAGFAMIMREEQNLEVKNPMLEYLGEIMEDAQDFSWQSAKASHAVLLCRMEEGKVDWLETAKIDKIQRAHVQRGVQSSNQKVGSKQQQNSDKKQCHASIFK